MTTTTNPAPNFFEEKHGIASWIFTTDHKRIGLMYLYSIIAFFCVGMALGIMMRLELMRPGPDFFKPRVYNSLFTLHGVIMIFLFIIPSIPATFGNFFLPIHLGADDVAFPKLNLLSFYCYMGGAILAVTTIFLPNGPADTGWTFYAPYSTTTTTNVSLSVLAAFIIGFSSILTGINFVTTIHRLRGPGMGWFTMPLFAWSLYATAWIQILATPVVAITLLLVIFDRVFHTGLFDATKGGDPILYQHLFWIYSHPAVYVMILPAMGVVSEIIPTFARRTIFGYKFIAFSSMAIALIGSLVWGHHMFTAGMSDTARYVFSLLTYLVAIPSAIKVFNWVATLYKGSIDLRPPLVYVLIFMFLFLIGGFTGLINGAVGPDIKLHDTYWVVGHFHYVMFGGTGLIFFAALHYWIPKMYGKLYNEKIANYCAGGIFIGFNLTYFSMLILGVYGMPRRYFDYLPKPEFVLFNMISTVGSWILVGSILIMFGNLLYAIRRGKPAPRDPWGGATLEWQTPSPPPLLNFEGPPDMSRGPYDY